MNTLRILIVEDDRQIAEIQRRFVERLENVELCGIAHSLGDARDLIDVMAPHLILLDIYFPDGNGLDLLRELRARDSSSDVILITAAKEVEPLKSALRGGVFDYILKPLVFERLEEAAATVWPGANRPERSRCPAAQRVKRSQSARTHRQTAQGHR